MRTVGIAALLTMPALLSLGGCFSPAVTMASYAVDGASYAVSDKSLSDHGLSAVKGEDCATWHFFVGRAVCEDPADPVPTAALDEHRRDGSVRHAAGFKHVAGSKRDGGVYLDAVVDGRGLARVVLGPLDAVQRTNLRALGIDGFAVDPPPVAKLSS
jgi:hypothetical protein